MEKKRYMPMEMKVEEFQMNEAVAACEYKPATRNAERIVCNQCKTKPHYWLAFDNDLPVEAMEADVLYVSASDPIDAQCKIVLNATIGQAFEGTASGQVSGGYLQEPLVNTTMTPKGYVDISSYIGGSGGVDTASLIQNS